MTVDPYRALNHVVARIDPDVCADLRAALAGVYDAIPEAEHPYAHTLGALKGALLDVIARGGTPAPCPCGADLTEHDLLGRCERTSCDGWRRVA